MKLARVEGTVVCTAKDPHLATMKLLLLQPLTENLEPRGDLFVAVDGIGVGRGEIVYWEGGPEAALVLPSAFGPADAAVVGIVDSAHVDRSWSAGLGGGN